MLLFEFRQSEGNISDYVADLLLSWFFIELTFGFEELFQIDSGSFDEIGFSYTFIYWKLVKGVELSLGRGLESLFWV